MYQIVEIDNKKGGNPEKLRQLKWTAQSAMWGITLPKRRDTVKQVAKFVMIFYISTSWGWIVFPPKCSSSPKPQYLRRWPYLKIGSLLRYDYLRWGHIGVGWGTNPIWILYDFP